MWLSVILLVAMAGAAHQAASGCKNCILLGKEEKAMFRAHSDACLSSSGVEPKLVDSLLAGELVDDEALKKHVYCVLLMCKVISKDGKLQKTAVLGKLGNRGEKNATKVWENCAEQSADTPEEMAWKLFRCGYDKKAVLFEYMPGPTGDDTDNDS